MAEPKIRFKKVDGTEYPEWEEKKIGDIGIPKMCRRVMKEQTDTKGDIPFYKIGTFGGTPDAFISRELYEDLKTNYSFPKKCIVLLSAAGTIGRAVIYDGEDAFFQDSNIVWLEHDDSILDIFLYHFYENTSWDNLEGGTVKRLYNGLLLDKGINIPSLEEQQKIASFFSDIDEIIAQSEAEVKALERQKKGMMQKIFSQEIRFKKDDGGEYPEWEEKKLEDFAELITKQTGFDYTKEIKPSLLQKNGPEVFPFIQNKDFSGTHINFDTDFYIPKCIAYKYPKILLNQDCLLISISGKIGNVGLYSSDTIAFIGGAVGICRLKKDTNGLFLLQELLSSIGQNEIKALIKASSHQNITVEDIRKLIIKSPCLEEQQKIADFLSLFDEAIDLAKQELKKWKLLKKGLLQQMFV